MTGAQVWTLLAIFSGFLTVLCTVIFAMLRTSIGGLRTEVDAKIDHLGLDLNAKIDGVASLLDAKIDALDAKGDERFDRITAVMGARFDDVDHRLTSVEGDLGLVKAHLIGQRSA